jgi:hypothetical protein
MAKTMIKPMTHPKSTLVTLLLVAWLLCVPALAAAPPASETLVVSAEGLADPAAEIYQSDKGLLLDALRQDALRQCVEKTVGTMVDSSTLVENFTLVQDRVLTRSKGLIKRVLKQSDPWLGEDGFMHLLVKAEVYLGQVKEAVADLSRTERIDLIKEYGNPKIAVLVEVRDAARGGDVVVERSAVAENLLKERLSGFGYRVWAVADASDARTKGADFLISGEAKFKALSARLPTSGITVTKHVLTSWTVQCKDVQTEEELYFNNKGPRAKSWADEDAALEDIGRMIGEEFSQDFFERHLMAPTRIFQMQIDGLADYDTGVLLKKELIGLRPVINVELRDYRADGSSLFEVEFSGQRGNFAQILNASVIAPLNAKLGRSAFRLVSSSGQAVRLTCDSGKDPAEMVAAFNSLPPASLADAPPERLRELIQSDTAQAKVQAINPTGVEQMAAPAAAPAPRKEGAVGAASSF